MTITNLLLSAPTGLSADSGPGWTGWPTTWLLWQQMGLAGVLILVVRYWLGALLKNIRWGWLDSRGGKLLKYAVGALFISYLTSSFCIGDAVPVNPAQWGFYGRMLLIGQTAFFTNLFARYYP